MNAPRGIREHFQDVIFFSPIVIDGFKYFLFVPLLLPVWFAIWGVVALGTHNWSLKLGFLAYLEVCLTFKQGLSSVALEKPYFEGVKKICSTYVLFKRISVCSYYVPK